MSRILFGQSYYLHFDPKLRAAMQPYPPLGTLYAASYVRKEGHDVALFDSMLADSEEGWAEALDHHRPRYAVLFEDNFNYLSKMCLLRMREAAFRMITMAKNRGCTVILCGADATDNADKYLMHGADYVILGEGEATLKELAEAFSNGAKIPVERIAGLAWHDEAGLKRQNPPRAPLAQLDALPFPAWDLVDVSLYRSLWMNRHGYFSMNMVTTRGCPYHCNWCAKPIWGQRYNSRSPENVAAELAYLRECHRPDHIWFADDIFGLKPGWIEAFGALIGAGKAIPFKCQMRADLVKPEVVEGLKAAACETVWLGAESGSQKILDAMEKGTTIEQIGKARRLLGEAGIRTAFFIQFGYPGETRADVELTLQMIRDLKPDDIGISISYPLPGTSFYERVRAEMGRKQNWKDSDDLAMLYRGPFPADFYRTLYHLVHSEFRMRKAVDKFGRGERDRFRRYEGKLRPLISITKNWFSWQVQRLRLNRFHANSNLSSSESVLL